MTYYGNKTFIFFIFLFSHFFVHHRLFNKFQVFIKYHCNMLLKVFDNLIISDDYPIIFSCDSLSNKSFPEISLTKGSLKLPDLWGKSRKWNELMRRIHVISICSIKILLDRETMLNQHHQHPVPSSHTSPYVTIIPTLYLYKINNKTPSTFTTLDHHHLKYLNIPTNSVKSGTCELWLILQVNQGFSFCR